MSSETGKKTAPARPVWWYIATWFGAGTSPVVSGTVGSLAALPFAYVIQITLGNVGLFAASLIIFCIGWWASVKFLQAMPEKGSDPKEIVVDEVAGQWLLLSIWFPTFHSYLLGFILFRLFDIVKPWPVSWADKEIKGGLGVMFDDMLAALYPIMVYLILMIITQLTHSPKTFLPIIHFLGGSYV